MLEYTEHCTRAARDTQNDMAQGLSIQNLNLHYRLKFCLQIEANLKLIHTKKIVDLKPDQDAIVAKKLFLHRTSACNSNVTES